MSYLVGLGVGALGTGIGIWIKERQYFVANDKL